MTEEKVLEIAGQHLASWNTNQWGWIREDVIAFAHAIIREATDVSKMSDDELGELSFNIGYEYGTNRG